MSTFTLSINLQQLMRIHSIPSVSELARMTDIPQPTIHHILSGSTKNPRKKVLNILSDFFSISVSQLIGQEPLPTIIPDSLKENLQINSIPIIEWHSIKNWFFSNRTEFQAKHILVDRNLGKNSFAVLISDTSMEPTFQQNSLLIFDAHKTPKDRDYVMVLLNKNNSSVFNRLFIENNIHYLKETLEDGNFQLTKLNTDVDKIIGTLIEVRIQF